MQLGPALAIFAAILIVATLTGVLIRRRDGAVRRVPTATAASYKAGSDQAHLDAADLGTEPFTADVTLVQFSTQTCSRCPGVRTLLTRIAAESTLIGHRDIDLTVRGELAKRLRILQTPTTFIIDSSGKVRSRIGGVPTRDTVRAEIDTILEESHV